MGKIDTSGWKKKKIDTMEWGEFHLYDIFRITARESSAIQLPR